MTTPLDHLTWWWRERGMRPRRCDWCRATYRPTQAVTDSRARFCSEACAVEDQAFMAW